MPITPFSELNVDTKGSLEPQVMKKRGGGDVFFVFFVFLICVCFHQPVQVLQIAKVKSLYSYYLGDLVTSNDLAVCYVVRVEEIRALHNDGTKLLLKGHVGQVFDIRFSPATPRLMASVCRGGRVLVWDLSRKQETPVLSLLTNDTTKPDVYANKLAWHHSANVLAVAFSNDSVMCLDLDVLMPALGEKPSLFSTLSAGATKISCSSAVLDLAFSARDPTVLATAEHEGSFTLWEWKNAGVVWQQRVKRKRAREKGRCT